MCYVNYVNPYHAGEHWERGIDIKGMDLTNKTRARIYEVIELSSGEDKLSTAYDLTMMVAILTSVVPLVFKQTNALFVIIDKITVTVFKNQYEMYKKLLIKGNIVLVKGLVQRRYDKYQIIVNKIEKLK